MAEKRCPGNAPPDPRLRLPGHLRPPEPPPLTGACAGDTALWVQYDTQDGTAYYLHLQTLQGTWERPPGGRLNTSHLTRKEIQVGGAPAGGRGWGSRGRGSHPRGTTALCRLHSPPSARSPLPMTASSSGRPARASSSGSRPGSEASWLGRGSPRAPASRGPGSRPSSGSRWPAPAVFGGLPTDFLCAEQGWGDLLASERGARGRRSWAGPEPGTPLCLGWQCPSRAGRRAREGPGAALGSGRDSRRHGPELSPSRPVRTEGHSSRRRGRAWPGELALRREGEWPKADALNPPNCAALGGRLLPGGASGGRLTRAWKTAGAWAGGEKVWRKARLQKIQGPEI